MTLANRLALEASDDIRAGVNAFSLSGSEPPAAMPLGQRDLAQLLGPKGSQGLPSPTPLGAKPKAPAPAQAEPLSQDNAMASAAANADLTQPAAPAGSAVDQAAMHSYISASPQHALPNLAPVPFIAQALFGGTSGLAPLPWLAQRVLGLGPPGTGFGAPAQAPAATPTGVAMPTGGGPLAPVEETQLPPVEAPNG